jgi:molybdenum cofactor cytidylyltransferase
MLEVAEASDTQSTFVVLGNHADEIKANLNNGRYQVVVNNKWQEGMASSIRCGLNAVNENHPDTDAVIIILCDQPYVSASLLNDIISKHRDTGKPIVASTYNDTHGVPALFHKKIFAELMHLKGDTGARSIIQKHPDDLALINFPQGNIDIDTMADYEKILKDEFPA